MLTCHFCSVISSGQPSGLQCVQTTMQLCSQKHSFVFVFRITVAMWGRGNGESWLHHLTCGDRESHWHKVIWKFSLLGWTPGHEDAGGSRGAVSVILTVCSTQRWGGINFKLQPFYSHWKIPHCALARHLTCCEGKKVTCPTPRSVVFRPFG